MRRVRTAAFLSISKIMEKQFTIYALKLNGGKWYIGRTENMKSRFAAHKSGRGSVWTKQYKPICIDREVLGDAFDEDKVTKQYMSEYGIDNVRGGSYVTMKLSKEQIKSLTAEINMAADKCVNCGEKGHFVKSCPRRKRMRHCERCGRDSHYKYKCYARSDSEGRILIARGKEYTCASCNSVIYHTEGCGCNLGIVLATPLITRSEFDVENNDEVDCDSCFRAQNDEDVPMEEDNGNIQQSSCTML